MGLCLLSVRQDPKAVALCEYKRFHFIRSGCSANPLAAARLPCVYLPMCRPTARCAWFPHQTAILSTTRSTEEAAPHRQLRAPVARRASQALVGSVSSKRCEPLALSHAQRLAARPVQSSHTAAQERHDQHALSSCVHVQDIPTTGPYLSCHASSPACKNRSDDGLRGGCSRQDGRVDPGRRELRAHETATNQRSERRRSETSPGIPQSGWTAASKKGTIRRTCSARWVHGLLSSQI